MSFAPESLEEVQRASEYEAEHLPINLAGRTEAKTIALDSAHTLDCDDGIWIEDLKNGNQQIIISIADVGSFLSGALAIRELARWQGESRYIAKDGRQQTIPMISRLVSEGSLSLLEQYNEDGTPIRRPAISFKITIDKNGKIVRDLDLADISFDSVAPRRLNFTHVSRLIAGRGSKADRNMIEPYLNVAFQLLSHRNGGVYDTATGKMSDEDGNIIRFPRGTRRSGQLIVQEFMIAANTQVANLMRDKNIPALYRNMQDQKAYYSPVSQGHSALGVENYMHITSPLRRFADFVNHCNLVAYLQNPSEPKYPYPAEVLEELAEHLNNIHEQTRVERNWARLAPLAAWHALRAMGIKNPEQN